MRFELCGCRRYVAASKALGLPLTRWVGCRFLGRLLVSLDQKSNHCAVKNRYRYEWALKSELVATRSSGTTASVGRRWLMVRVATRMAHEPRAVPRTAYAAGALTCLEGS
ncbi:hypothetical protein CSUI_010540, partial [Cystoisospora suis]